MPSQLVTIVIAVVVSAVLILVVVGLVVVATVAVMCRRRSKDERNFECKSQHNGVQCVMKLYMCQTLLAIRISVI